MNISMRTLWVCLGALFLTACASTGKTLSVEDAWARPVSAGTNAAVYFTISNPSPEADRLLHASAQISRAVEIHETSTSDAGEDILQMLPQSSVPVPARGTVVFEPGGHHVMLVDVQRDLAAGESFPLRLNFENAGAVDVEVFVEDR
jgi:hypothetical protein